MPPLSKADLKAAAEVGKAGRCSEGGGSGHGHGARAVLDLDLDVLTGPEMLCNLHKQSTLTGLHCVLCDWQQLLLAARALPLAMPVRTHCPISMAGLSLR